ncbi:synaptonemal complex protein 1-like [Vespa crabro]|uniref:synaptonemal complex protein 1-like n=1 Tax=Vespa crabro TaxID=7445 RepID=UPI001F02E616|nr:synaptonemal complex protein 1-like [Vespa crabro]
MDNYCSPQWVDFTSNLEVPSDNYFDEDHEIDKYRECLVASQTEVILTETEKNEKISKETKESIKLEKKTFIESSSDINEEVETELNIIKNTPIKLMYTSSTSSYGSSKCKLLKKVSYNDIIQEAMENLQNCVLTPSNVFKKPMLITNEASKLEFQDNNQVNCSSSKEIEQVTKDLSDEEIKSLSASITKHDIDTTPQNNLLNPNKSSINLLKYNEFDQKLDCDNNTACHTSENSTKLSLKVNMCNKQNSCKSIEKSNGRKQSRTLSYQCRRQSLTFRRHSNRYISSAAAVLQYQNKTPERFHSQSRKKQKESKVNETKENHLKLKSTKQNLSNSLFQTTSNKNVTLTDVKKSKIIKSNGSCSNASTKRTSRNKNVFSAIVDNNGSGLVIKKEKILFYDIPIDSKQKKTTRPIPFSFENRDKLKQESKLKQSQLNKNDNKNIENLPNKKNLSMIKGGSSLSIFSTNSQKNTSINIREKKLLKVEQENKQCDVNASTTNEINIDQKGNIKPKVMKIGMNSYERAKQRHEFDEKIKQKIIMQEKERQKEEEKKLAKEKLQIAVLRKQTEMKARPMPVFKPPRHIKSLKPLTEPHSPAWAHKNKKSTS